MHLIEHTDLGSKVYEQIKEMILSGELVPGQKIRQEQFADQIGVSRTPLLKALQRLENDLLVEAIPRRGVYVRQIGTQELVDAFDCREGLEGVAARLAAERRTAADVKELKGLFAPFLGGPRPIPPKPYAQADRIFHRLLIQTSGNRFLGRVETLGNILLICYNRGLVRPPEETLSEHVGIVEAIEKGDGDLAEQRAKEHIRRSRNLITQGNDAEDRRLAQGPGPSPGSGSA